MGFPAMLKDAMLKDSGQLVNHMKKPQNWMATSLIISKTNSKFVQWCQYKNK